MALVILSKTDLVINNQISSSGFFQDLKTTPITFSFEGMDRLFRAHGYTLHDVTQLRSGTFPQIPDVVVWPGAPLLTLKFFKVLKIIS